MALEIAFKIGDIVDNSAIVDTFKCGNMGGMRRSHATNTLVIISDYTKGLYHDKWIGGVLHYTGMGKRGNQDINWAQNATLAASNSSGVEVHLFEVLQPGCYTYCGIIKLVGEPYTEIQQDEDGENRKVWMFPVAPVEEQTFSTPEAYTFSSEEDFKKRGVPINVVAEGTRTPKSSGAGQRLTGQKIRHKAFGTGTVKSLKDGMLNVKFEDGEMRSLNYDICKEKELIEFL